MARCIAHGQVFQRWFDAARNPSLCEAVLWRPRLLGFVERPFVNAEWPVDRRLAVVETHFRMVDSLPELLRFLPWRHRVLWQEEIGGHRLSVVLDRPIWFIGEGELALNLMQDDTRLYTLAFAFGQEEQAIVAFVGALQGCKEGAATYRELTHALHGLRPRDFLFAAFRMLCTSLGVEYILATSDRTRQHRSQYFGEAAAEAVRVNYDDMWTEYRGALRSDGLFVVDAAVTYRAPEEIPSRKRAQYRRRYEMLDGVHRSIADACGGKTLSVATPSGVAAVPSAHVSPPHGAVASAIVTLTLF